MSERCGTCRFWPRYPYAEANDVSDAGDAGGDQSDCRRHAPIAAVVDNRAVWPRVGARDWCGDFEPRLKPADVRTK